ncbi:MAG TPA: hypothetical protein VLU25_17375 [Acidobacteriota bacterium]|nr:hypothetical protein [Acidobacteriota bacterium]
MWVDWDLIDILIGLIHVIIPCWLLWSGYRQKVLSRMPLFYVFVAVCLIQEAVLRLYERLGEGDFQWFVTYSWLYYTSEYVIWILQICILIWFYRMFRGHRDGMLWLVLGTFAMLMNIFYALPHDLSRIGSLWVVLKAWLLNTQAVLLALVLYHVSVNRRMRIGLTHLYILIGLSMKTTLEYIPWGLYVSQIFPYHKLVMWLTVLPVFTWIFWFWTLRSYSPSVAVPEMSVDERMRRSEKFEKAVKSLLRKSSS